MEEKAVLRNVVFPGAFEKYWKLYTPECNN